MGAQNGPRGDDDGNRRRDLGPLGPKSGEPGGRAGLWRHGQRPHVSSGGSLSRGSQTVAETTEACAITRTATITYCYITDPAAGSQASS